MPAFKCAKSVEGDVDELDRDARKEVLKDEEESDLLLDRGRG